MNYASDNCVKSSQNRCNLFHFIVRSNYSCSLHLVRKEGKGSNRWNKTKQNERNDSHLLILMRTRNNCKCVTTTRNVSSSSFTNCSCLQTSTACGDRNPRGSFKLGRMIVFTNEKSDRHTRCIPKTNQQKSVENTSYCVDFIRSNRQCGLE